MESKILVLLPVESWGKGRQLMKYNKSMAQILKEMNQIKEGDEVSMAIGQLKTLIDNANALLSSLQSKGDDFDIEAWIQAKITDAENGMSAAADYMKNNPEADEVEESIDLSEAVEMPKSDIDNVKSFTDRNQHYEARAYICARMKDGRLKSIYNEVGSLQDKYNKELGYLLSRNVRDQLDKMVLLPKMKRAFKNWKEIYSSI